MDSQDLFWQLTRGVHFTKKKSKKNIQKKMKQEPEVPIKLENDLHFPSGANIENAVASLKSDEEENTFKFLEGSEVTVQSKKKKKKVLSEEDRQKHLHNEMVTTLRKENRITILGRNVPDPIQTFEELQIDYKVMDRLIKNIAVCNFPKPTPVQMQAIPIMLKGRHLMACAPTGSGKTIAFLAPILNDLKAPSKLGFRALVLAPTRELAQQIYRECVRLSEKTFLKIHIFNKIGQVEQNFGANSSKKCDILISTPNRVRYLLQQEPPLLDLKSVEWLVIDEADRLMDETQDNFKEQLDDILVACSNTNKKMALFSATYTVPVSKWVLKHLKNAIRITVGQQNSATELVDQELLFVGSENGKLLAIRDMVKTGLKPPVLIFVQSKERAKQLFTELLYDGINVDVIHADRTQLQRDNCVRAFREGHIWVLICTDLMGRGIDFKGVNLVINYDFPPSTIAYIHRVGRTGRAGRKGRSVTFFTQEDTPNLKKIAEIIKNSGGKVPDFLLNLKKSRKSEIKKYEKFAPKRADISTKIKPENTQNDKIENLNKLRHKRAKQNNEKLDDTKEIISKKIQNLKKIKEKTVTNCEKLVKRVPKPFKNNKTKLK